MEREIFDNVGVAFRKHARRGSEGAPQLTPRFLRLSNRSTVVERTATMGKCSPATLVGVVRVRAELAINWDRVEEPSVA